jgi:hypothetical protein
MPLSEEIDPQLPVVEIVAEELGLGGVFDRSKVGAASLFFWPSCPPGTLHRHEEMITPGAPIRADWITKKAAALLATRQAEANRIAAAAQAEAAARQQAKLAAGFDPNESLIERIRSHLDLATVLARHSYKRSGHLWRHPNSQSGGFGLNIKTLGGVERAFSHNAGDPLHANNLPDWCGVTALDAFDVVTILVHRFHKTSRL